VKIVIVLVFLNADRNIIMIADRLWQAC